MAQANAEIHSGKKFKYKKLLILLFIALISIGSYIGNNLYKEYKINKAIKTSLTKDLKGPEYKFVNSYSISGHSLNLKANNKYQSLEDGDKYDILHELYEHMTGLIVNAYKDNGKNIDLSRLVLEERIKVNYQGKNDTFNYAGISFSNGESLNSADMEKWSSKKPLDVQLEVNVVIFSNKPRFVGITNLPDGTELEITLTSKNSSYNAQSKMTVNKGRMESSLFSDNGAILDSGEYSAEIFTPTANVLPVNVRRVIGQIGENMRGPLVKSNSVWGYQVKLKKTFTIQ